MPEGHTIHRIARDHAKWFAGQELIVLSPQGRFVDEAKRLSGNQLLGTSAIGKHLFYHWPGGVTMHVHLGLYGKFRVHRNPPPVPRGAVRVRMIGEERAFDLNGPNRCELLSESAMEKLKQRLGQDPLDENADKEVVWQKITRSRAAIGSLLLNQSVIAGLGNIYRAEILFLLGIYPERTGREISREEFDRIWELSVKLLHTGVRYNKIITVDTNQSGEPASRLKSKERLNIYKQDNCPNCGGEIYYWTLAARTIYACDACQN